MKSVVLHRQAKPSLAVLLSLFALGAPPAEAQVSGRVVDNRGLGVAVDATLEVYDGQQFVYQEVRTTDPDGYAIWDDAPASAEYQARIRANYDGGDYASPGVVIGDVEHVELIVYPVAREGRPLHLDTLHIIVDAASPEKLRVLQFMTVSNAGAAAYAGGPMLRSGQQAGLVIPLPLGAMGVQPAPFPTPSAALTSEHAEFGSDRILDSRPVPPMGRQVAVTYELPTGPSAENAQLLLPYPTAAVSVLIGGPGRAELTLSSAQLVAAGPEPIGEEIYDLWTGQALDPGTELELSFAPPRVPWGVGRISLGAAILAVIAGIAGTLFAREGPANRSDVRAEIIDRLASLDAKNESGGLTANEYFDRRARELEKLALVDDHAAQEG